MIDYFEYKAMKEQESYDNFVKRMDEMTHAAIELGKTKYTSNIFNQNDMKEKKTIYFKEDTQELLTTPITDKNCYYLGEFKPKVINRIKNLLKESKFDYCELKKLLHYDKKFRFSYNVGWSLQHCVKNKSGLIYCRIMEFKDFNNG